MYFYMIEINSVTIVMCVNVYIFHLYYDYRLVLEGVSSYKHNCLSFITQGSRKS